MKNSSPAELARETLKRLAEQSIAPTPENYQACYRDIAKLPDRAPFPEVKLRGLAAALPAASKAQREAVAAFENAIAQRSWLGMEAALVALLKEGAEKNRGGAEGAATTEQVSPDVWAKLAGLIESVLPALGEDLAGDASALHKLVRAMRGAPVEIDAVRTSLITAARQIPLAAAAQREMQETLLRLLWLIVENLGDLTLDDQWFEGRLDALRTQLARPISLRRMEEAERGLHDLIAARRQIRQQALQTQVEMRAMLSAFVRSLSEINASSSTFQRTLETGAQQIGTATRIEELAPLLGDLLAATRTMAEETAANREQLVAMQEKVEHAEAALSRLYLELDKATQQARHDPLTDALNRKGLDDALAREIAVARRTGLPLSLCMIDIDDFKKLNDELGHDSGDHALVHFTRIARDCMRPTDSLCRYGGEEFVILMPDTTPDQGVEVITRLQRSLTKAIFLASNQKQLITFSGGVVQLEPGESGADAIKRADQAMYCAKRAGKNRVLAG